ncbi:MAG: hypothetical protein WKF86_09075 [Acidimicrobiales bacterium]
MVGLVVVGGAVALRLREGKEPETHTIYGDMTLADYEGGLKGCYGAGGYSDIGTGTAVTVKNEAGTLIASGSLRQGNTSGLNEFRVCVFRFEVAGVPDAKFFQVEVSRRGGLTYSKAEMVSKAWNVHASLGD